MHLIHDDSIPENVIRTRTGLVLVDWELATYDYFFYDFGCLLGENHLSEKKEKTFLQAYGFGMNEKEQKIIHAVKLKRILASIAWLVERIATIKQGQEIFKGQNIRKYEKKLKEEIKYLTKLLKNQTL